jgi:multiple sugar transport system permease protein/raffinose/stachyose/melibiose transport system permease protein
VISAVGFAGLFARPVHAHRNIAPAGPVGTVMTETATALSARADALLALHRPGDPVVLPTVAIALLYQKLFQSAPVDGLVNELLVNVGLSSVDWLGAGTTAFVVIVIMDVWRSVGFYGVLVFSGLLDIPDEIIESARIDGAKSFKLLRHIVLPMSLPILFASFIFSINGTIKVFDSVFALTGGGPGNSTTPLTLYMYRTAFQFSDYGYGSTIALLLTVMCLVVTLVIFRSSRRDLSV